MWLIAGLLKAGSGPGGKIFRRHRHPPPPHTRQGVKEESVIRKTRWPLVARAVRTTNRY